jgi:hypothetical protein
MSEALTRALLLDIEGTTSSLSFVKDELFPYARARLSGYMAEHAEALGTLFDDVRRIEGNPALDTAQLAAILVRWIDEDRKATPLKSLQGTPSMVTSRRGSRDTSTRRSAANSNLNPTESSPHVSVCRRPQFCSCPIIRRKSVPRQSPACR